MNVSNRVKSRTNNETRNYYQTRWLNVFLVVVVLGSLLWIGFSEFNPDWQSYQLIYDTGGAWLADQGRDQFFLFLIELANSLLGPSGYEAFRLALSFYFLFFSTIIAFGKIIPIARSRWMAIQFPLAIISFGLTRFTVQIREGIAVTLILIGFACVMRADATINLMKRRIFIWLGLVLVGCAVLIHLGTIFIFVGLLLGLFSQHAGEIKAKRMKLLWAVVSIIGFMVLGWIAVGGLLEQVSSSGLGISERVYFTDEARLTLPKLILWGGYGFVSVVIAKALKELVSTGQLRGRLAATLVVTSGPITFMTLISIYVLIIIGAPNFFTGQYVRLLNILLGINLLFVASASNRVTVIVFCSMFLMSYQVRSILDSVSKYFGVNLL